MSNWRILHGDVREQLRLLADGSVQTCVTSPPYWGLRDYGSEPIAWGGDPACSHEWGALQRTPYANAVPGPGGRGGKNTARNVTKSAGQFCQSCGAWMGALGLEPTPELFVSHLIGVFAEVWRVLANDGVCWVNLGDCYATGAGAVGECPGGGAQGDRWRGDGRPEINGHGKPTSRTKERSGHEGKQGYRVGPMTQPNRLPIPGLKTKDLVGVPWRFAFAAQAAGWYLRSDIIWNKPNPMPESIKDRPTKSHEYIFLLTKRERYFYDHDAIKEPYAESTLKEIRDGYEGEGTKDYDAAGVQDPSDVKRRIIAGAKKNDLTGDRRKEGFNERWDRSERQNNLRRNAVEGDDYDMRTAGGRNKRSVWTVPTQPYPDAHFATFPEALIEPCILAGSRLGDTVLDPFCGSGTTGAVAIRHGRSFVGTELNQDYITLARRRIGAVAPLFATEAVS